MKHFLLAYDQKRGTLVSKVAFDDGREAIRSRMQLERTYRGSPHIEIVVLSAQSEYDLKVSHGRFFHDLEEMVTTAAAQVSNPRVAFSMRSRSALRGGV